METHPFERKHRYEVVVVRDTRCIKWKHVCGAGGKLGIADAWLAESDDLRWQLGQACVRVVCSNFHGCDERKRSSKGMAGYDNGVGWVLDDGVT